MTTVRCWEKWHELAFYSVLATLFVGGRDVFAKHNLKSIDSQVVAFGQQFFAWVLMLCIVVLTGVPALKEGFWPAFVVLFFFAPFWPLLFMKAIKHSQLSVVMPLMALIPVFVSLETLLFGIAFPTIWGWMGIGLIVGGVYSILLGNSQKVAWSSPLTAIKENKGAQYMLAVVIAFSIGSHSGRILTTTSSPLFAAFSTLTVSVFGMTCIQLFRGEVKILKQAVTSIKEIAPVGIFHGVSELLTRVALGIGYTPYVSAVLRLNIVWFSASGIVLFKEQLNKRKILGGALVFLGLLCLVLYN